MNRSMKPDRKMNHWEFGISHWDAPSAGAIRNPQSAFAGFTLIEVLVASAILAFLLVTFLSISSYASQAWKSSQQKMEEFSTARVVLNRIRSDLETIVIRPDLPLFPNNTVGFMTLKRGVGTDPRLLSYVEYSTNSSNQVIRASHAYSLTSDPPPFSTNSTIPSPGTTTNNSLANGIIGFQTSYLSKNGSWTTSFNSKYDTNTSIATNSTVAVRVSLVMVSSEGLRHLQDTGKLADLAGYMSDPGLTTAATSPTNSPEGYWNNEKINKGTNSSIGMDLPTIRSLRTFERVFFLPDSN